MEAAVSDAMKRFMANKVKRSKRASLEQIIWEMEDVTLIGFSHRFDD